MENHFVTFMLGLLLSYVAFWSPFVEKFPLYNLYILWVSPTHTHPNLICVDYHKLNKVTLPDPNTMPLIEELLNAVGRASCPSQTFQKVSSKVHLSNTAREKSAIITPFGKFEYKVFTRNSKTIRLPLLFQLIDDQRVSVKRLNLLFIFPSFKGGDSFGPRIFLKN